MGKLDSVAPVLPISNRDRQRMERVGYALIRVQNDVVAIVTPVDPVPFRRGATVPEIVAEWEKVRGQPDN